MRWVARLYEIISRVVDECLGDSVDVEGRRTR